MHTMLLQEAADLFGLTPSDLTSPTRQRHINEARQALMYALRARTSMSLAAIGQALGGRDHTTVLHGLVAAEQRAVVDAAYASQLAALMQGA